MKKLTFLLICTFVLLNLSAATTPEKVYPITRVQKTLDYYQEQIIAWKEILQEQPQSGEAWLNYYTAAHCANRVSGIASYNLEAIVQEMINKLPKDQFEYYYLQAWQKGIDAPDYFQLLTKAYAIAPDRHEAYDGLILHHEMQGEEEQVRFFCKKWLESGAYSPGILRWNYNLLMSIEPNGILITNGDNTTFPVWLLQHGKEIRPDIITTNISLLAKPDYRSRIFKKMNIPILDLPTPENTEEEIGFYENLVDHMLNNTSKAFILQYQFFA